jgi:hypothetical protein
VTVSTVLELVARMRREAFSRNRNFDAFATADTEARRARRLWRYLRSLEQDLSAALPRVGLGIHVEVENLEEGHRRITIEVPEVSFRRVATLTQEEYNLLREHPEARSVLDRIEGVSTSA